jgi:multiple sugar transport system substrate-binding protein
MRKIVIVLVIALVAALLMPACGTAPVQPDATPPVAGLPAEPRAYDPGEEGGTGPAMRIAWWGTATRHQLTQDAIELFKQLNPGLEVEAEFTAWDAYWDMMSARAASGNMPDVFQQDYQFLRQYVGMGLTHDLTDFIGNGINADYIDDSTWVGGSVDGRVYAITLGYNSQAIAYDPALFEQAGVPAPPERWTWDEYIDTARRLYAALDIYGDEHFLMGHYHGLNLWMRQHGYSVYNRDGTGLGYTDDSLFARYYQMDYDLTKEGVFAPTSIRDEIQGAENTLIITERAAMYGSLGGSNLLVAMVNAAGRPLRLASLPHIPNEISGQFLKPSQYFCISSGSSFVPESVLWLDFITNNIECNMILMGERGVPVSSAVREAMLPNLDDTQREIFRYYESVSRFAHPIGLPEPPQHAELVWLLREIRHEMSTGEITTLEGAQKFRAAAETAFS